MKYLLFITSLLFVSYTSLFAQQEQKVGLVMSGGGSKGLAHIGVIRALEEKGIPISYVSGTSMGAIIAGLYASGYSPAQMEEIFLSHDFEYWISGKMPQKYVYYFRAKDPSPEWTRIYIDLGEKISSQIVPTNLVSPYLMDFAFLEIFSGANAAAKNNFDSLMVPFRCISTNISEHKPYIACKGDLGLAIRASMTIPFYFKPVQIDKHIMFDGGIVNNFPVDVMKKDFNPDYIIGCKVAGNFDTPKEGDLVSQLGSIVTDRTDYSIPGQGILIEPSLEQSNMIDFNLTKQYIDSGYAITLRYIDSIRQVVHDSVPEISMQKKRAAFYSKFPRMVIDSITVEGVTESQQAYIVKDFIGDAKEENEEIDLAYIKNKYFRMLSEKNIQSVFPSLIYDTTLKAYNMHLDVKSDKRLSIGIGGLISSSSYNQAYFDMSYKRFSKIITDHGINLYLSQFYNSVQLSQRLEFLSKSFFFLDMYLNFNQQDFFKTRKTYFEDEESPSYVKQREFFFNTDVVFPATPKSRFTVGGTFTQLKYSYFQSNSFTKTDTSDVTFFSPGVLRFKYDKNSLNQKQFATRGCNLEIRLQGLYGKERFIPGSTSINMDASSQTHYWGEIKIIYDRYFPVWQKYYTIGLYLEGFFTDNHLFSNYTSTVLNAGSFAPIPESQLFFMPKYRTNQYMAGGMKNIITITKNLHLRIEEYLFQPIKEIKKAEDNTAFYGNYFEKRYFMTSIAAVYRLPFGPVSLSFNHYSGFEQPYSVTFNIGYILFNRKGYQ